MFLLIEGFLIGKVIKCDGIIGNIQKSGFF